MNLHAVHPSPKGILRLSAERAALVFAIVMFLLGATVKGAELRWWPLVDREPGQVFTLVITAGFLIGAATMLQWLRRSYRPAALWLSPAGWRKSVRPPRKVKAWPRRGRVELRPRYQTGDWVLELFHVTREAQFDSVRQRLDTPAGKMLTSLYGRPTPGLLRAIEDAGPLLNSVFGPPPSQALLTIPMCPECGYDLRHARVRPHADNAAGRCAECGFAWEEDELFLLGRPGLSWQADQSEAKEKNWFRRLPSPLQSWLSIVMVVVVIIVVIVLVSTVLPEVLRGYFCLFIMAFFVCAALWPTIRNSRRAVERRLDTVEGGSAEDLRPTTPGDHVLRLQRGGVAMHKDVRREQLLWPWTDLRWQVHRVPGGVRLAGWRRGGFGQRVNVLDFVRPTAEPNRDLRDIRRRLRQWQRESRDT